MDSGHFNCRDYTIDPPSGGPHPQRIHPSLYRHESWSELEQRARSPASRRPKFPLLALPLELRQHIFRYLLPYTTELRGASPLANHVRNFHAVKARNLPAPAPLTKSPTTNVVWHKGDTALFAVCRQLHAECADLVYGSSTFILFVTYAGISIRFRYLLPTGVSPTTHKPSFLDWVPPRYLPLMRKFAIHIDHVDQYTGQTKFNVGGKGLVHGLQRQIQRLVDALTSSAVPPNTGEPQDSGASTAPAHAQITHLTLRISNGSAAFDSLKTELERRHRAAPPRIAQDLAIMLSPFLQLQRIRHVSVSGAITPEFAVQLETAMRGERASDAVAEEEERRQRAGRADGGGGMQDVPPGVHICAYGNDL